MLMLNLTVFPKPARFISGLTILIFIKSMKEGKLLIADDNKGILNALQILLQREFNLVRVLPGPNQLMSELEPGKLRSGSPGYEF